MSNSQVCNHLRSAALVVDERGRVLERNERAEALLFSQGELGASSLDELFGEEFTQRHLPPGLLGGKRAWSKRVEGAFAGRIDCYPLEEDRRDLRRCLLILTDTHDLPEDSDAMPLLDKLTGLPNIQALYDKLDRHYLVSSKEERAGALLLVAFDDVYRFDTRSGSRRGDKVLVELAKKLSDLLGDSDYLAYIGDEKFVYVLSGIQRINDAEAFAKRLLHLNAEPVAIEGDLFYLNISIGIAFFPYDSRESAELVRLADRAMREAKVSGWNRISLFNQLHTDTPLEDLEYLRQALPEAIETEEIYFLFQPQYCLKRQRYVGAEMLVRWNAPRAGELGPDLFLPLAEQTGMIRSLTNRALIQAAKTFEKLEEVGATDFTLSINLSPTLLFHRDFLSDLEFFFDAYGLRGRSLRFEITENIFAHNMTVMREILSRIQEMGIQIEIDDYGTGYTSLRTLTELPVHTLKIDREYVRRIDQDLKTHRLFKAMLQTAGALGLEVVAEGVERQEEQQIVAQYGPLIIQGWYYARAMSEASLLELLNK
ncbi:putative bifunctional diguanylate cyclase/phosphodiesterase [Nitratifractor sp.]